MNQPTPFNRMSTKWPSPGASGLSQEKVSLLQRKGSALSRYTSSTPPETPMRRRPSTSFCVALVLATMATAPSWAAIDQDMRPGLSGVVKHGPGPLEQAGVYAYRVTDLDLTRVTTGEDGRFLFRTLPAGVYKIIAHKVGYVPAVVLFTRATQMASDFLEFELVAEARADYGSDDDFWSIRRKIPGDVLRDIQLAEAARQPPAAYEEPGFELQTELAGGSRDFGSAGSSQVQRGRVGLESQVGATRLAVDGSFENLRPDTSGSGSVSGHTHAVNMSLRHGEQGRSGLSISALQHAFDSPYSASRLPVELASYQARWTRLGADGSTTGVSAMAIGQQGFHVEGQVYPVGVPQASQTMFIDTFHRRELATGHSLRTGVQYRRIDDTSTRALGRLTPGHEWVNAYGIASTQLPAGIVVEYGLYSTVLNGGVSFSPHTSLIMELGKNWRAETVVRQRLGADEAILPSFTAAYYRDVGSDTATEDHYYEVGITRDLGDSEQLAVGASHREISDTVRVYFNEDFFHQVESVYLVRGDVLPELQIALTQKLAPNIYTTLESNIADGGGGIFRSPERGQYSNKVRYLVTSMDTDFQRTATGLLLAFHRVEQSLNPMMSNFAVGLRSPTLSRSLGDTELDTLQVQVTQELPFLLDFGTNLAVLLNLELSRGASPHTESVFDEDQLRRRVAGGIALRF